jgi:Homeodomain-like domain
MQVSSLSSVDGEVVEIASLRTDLALRIDGTSSDHVAVLTEVGGELPPIVVHRPTMLVVDGVHRVLAAQARGECQIAVVYIDGDEVDALIEGLRANSRHGLPLSRRDRQAAVGRLLAVRPEWSDRRIAAAVGVSHRTVGAIRHRSSGQFAQPNVRVGLDGRVRPRDRAGTRARAAALPTGCCCWSGCSTWRRPVVTCR